MTREGEEGAGEVSCIPDADNVSIVVLWQRVCGCVEAGRGVGDMYTGAVEGVHGGIWHEYVRTSQNVANR